MFKLFGTRSGILCVVALLTVIAFSMAACDSDFGSSGGKDSRLNGTWVSYDTDGSTIGFTFKNGNWEYAYRGKPWWKGTYTTYNNRLTMTLTHITEDGGDIGYLYKLVPGKWYSRADLKALGVPEDYLRDQFDDLMLIIYSINGNALYFTFDGNTTIFYKR
jgi:hypothetical protein